MVIKEIRQLLHLVTRKKIAVKFPGDSVAPVSRLFGTDRGTPIDRYYIESFLKCHANQIKARVLEVGEDRYAGLFGGDDVSLDLLNPATTTRGMAVHGDLASLKTLPASTYDCFICTQTLNFIFDINSAIAGAHYLLKPGGVLLATVAGISQISRYDMERWGDYWRFTTLSLQKLFEPVFGTDVTIESRGNALAACAFLQGLAVEDLPDSSLLWDNDPDYQLIITVMARKKE